jgi:hypothetical protein
MKKELHTIKDKKKYFLELLDKYFNPPFYKKLLANDNIDEERQQIIAEFSGIDWRKINPDIIISNCQSLFFFSDEAFRYYLPAFMKVCFTIKDANEVKGVVLSSLTPPKDNLSLNKFIDTMSKFSNVQKGAILLFLEILKDEQKDDFPAYNLNKIINQYWYQFKKYQTQSNR